MGWQSLTSYASPMSGLAPKRVIVTRPLREAADWVQRLQEAGFNAEAFPLIEIAPASDDRALKGAWQQLAGYTACLFVSVNAVDYFLKDSLKKSEADEFDRGHGGTARLGEIPAEVRFMAPGPGTRAALIAAGVPPAQIDAPDEDARQFDSEALWDVIGQRDWQGCRVLIVRGQNAPADPENRNSIRDSQGQGRDWIARRWQSAGAQVDFISVYERRAPVLSDTQITRAISAGSDGSIWLFSSSEAVINLMSLLDTPDFPALKWRHARAIATHSRIAETLHAAGWGVVKASRPALNEIKVALHSIESTQL